MSTKVCIIRHGETDWNKEGRLQGHTDIPLNDTGRKQALAMASNAVHFNFDALYSSDLMRAIETAKALAQYEHLELKMLTKLRERHFGFLQGLCKSELPETHPEAFALYDSRDVHHKFETGESLLEFNKRVIDVFNDLVKHHSNQQIAVVCHAGLLDSMRRLATGQPLHTERNFHIPNSALNWFHFDGNKWHLDQWDDHHHVKDVIKDSVE